MVSRSWKRQGKTLSLEASKRGAALITPWFSSMRSTLDFLSIELWDNMFVILCHYVCDNLLHQQWETNILIYPAVAS